MSTFIRNNNNSNNIKRFDCTILPSVKEGTFVRIVQQVLTSFLHFPSSSSPFLLFYSFGIVVHDTNMTEILLEHRRIRNNLHMVANTLSITWYDRDWTFTRLFGLLIVGHSSFSNKNLRNIVRKQSRNHFNYNERN